MAVRRCCLCFFIFDRLISALAIEYWIPRMAGASLGVALWAILGFFNGIARPQVTLFVNLGVAGLNAVLNQVFIVEMRMGIAGSAWATTVALGCGVVIALCLFLGPGPPRVQVAPDLAPASGETAEPAPTGLSDGRADCG